MEIQTIILIGGALALVYYIANKKVEKVSIKPEAVKPESELGKFDPLPADDQSCALVGGKKRCGMRLPKTRIVKRVI